MTAAIVDGYERGVAPLERILRDECSDIRDVTSVEEFGRWLGAHISRWDRDPSFRQRSLIRDLRRAHPEIAALEREYRSALRSCDSSESGRQLMQIERRCANTRKAIAGIERAIESASAVERERLSAKLETYHDRARVLAAERRSLLRRSGDCREARMAERRLERARRETGLVEEEMRPRSSILDPLFS